MRIRSERLTKFAAWLVVATLKLLFATCRKEFVIFPGTNGWDSDLPGRFLYCVWHDVLFFPMLMAKPHNGSALTSRHQDGAYVAETLRLLNVQPFRGSTNRGGAQAIRQLLNVAEQLHITITPDGPRGPRREMKDGIVFLASRTGMTIVPAAFTCRRGVRLRGTWTDMLLPLPFTTTYCILGEPIAVTADLNREEIDLNTQRVQDAMNRLYARIEDWAAGRAERPEFEEALPVRKAA
ncbi:MAG: lysophospholipid acyltransferase family protein [Planctomycetaceae bacterium]